MNQSYRVVVVSPEGYAHSGCFIEVARLLVSTFVSLGIDCDITINDCVPDRINILLGFHLLTYNDSFRQFRYIPYQLEQLSDKEGAYSDNLRLLLENAFSVWDYSRENILFLQRKGISAKHLPVGYHQGLEMISPSAEKEIDVLFFGSVGQRRKTVLDQIAANPRIKLKVLFGVYGQQRDEWVARSRMILNIHYYEARIFEAVRISYLINNQCFVLTEDSVDNPYPDVKIPTARYEDLASRCEFYLSNDVERERLRVQAYEQFKAGYPMERLLEELLRRG